MRRTAISQFLKGILLHDFLMINRSDSDEDEEKEKKLMRYRVDENAIYEPEGFVDIHIFSNN